MSYIDDDTFSLDELIVKDDNIPNTGTNLPEEILNTNHETGLTSDEANQRLSKYGANTLEGKKESLWIKFLRNFWGPIPIIIMIAGILSGYLQDYIDLGLVFFLLFLNAIVGFVQERKAANVIETLKSTLALNANVRRGGQDLTIPAIDLVPGDIIMVEVGDIVPADARIIGENMYLQVDQSTLTGESLAVEKREKDLIYSSSGVKRGMVRALVIATGKHTFIGRTASLTHNTAYSDNYNHVLANINNFILTSCFVINFIIFIILIAEIPDLARIIELILILTVSSLPIALPTVLTVTMAIGAQNLAKRKAIVSRLAAIEELAGVDVLCTDKTGTLTCNSLTIHTPYIFKKNTTATADSEAGAKSIISDSSFITGTEKENENDESENFPQSSLIREILTVAALSSERHSNENKMDAIDRAIIAALSKYHVDVSVLDEYHCINFKSFDPVTKRVEGTFTKDDTTIIATKGAPQVILDLIKDPSEDYLRIVNKFAARGFRSLGVAQKINDQDWELLGIIPLFDPPRKDSAATLRAAQRLGLKIKMLTGDSIAIAKETAHRLGMGTNILGAENLTSNTEPFSELGKFIENADGFAQVFPEHKYDVVKVLQGRKHIVAMTGDGVNDAPSLKKADVGIAVHGASDAARDAASIVFLEPGLSVIIDAIRESRKIFSRMHGYAVYRISHSLHLLIFIFILVILRVFFPVNLLIMLAIFSDLSVLLIGIDRAGISRDPEKWYLKQIFGVAVGIGTLLSLFTLVLYGVLLHQGFTNDQIISLIFLEVALTENQLIFSTRNRNSFVSKPYPSLWLILTVFLVDAAATLMVIFAFISPAKVPGTWIVIVWIYSVAVFVIIDVLKMTVIRYSKSRKSKIV